MKIALPFQVNGKYNNEADEFIINYSEDKNKYEKLVDFVTAFPRQTICINYLSDLDFDKIDTLNKIGKIKIILTISKIKYAEELVRHNIKFYFKDIPACNYNQLHSLFSLGVSDIYIIDDLCYELPRVRKYCADNDVNMRVILNRIPIFFYDAKNSEIMFYRPEDTFWREYFDIAEFDIWENNKENWNLLNVLYETYFINKRWFGNLQEIIRDLPFPIYNKALIPDFNEYRFNCKLICKNRHSICQKCKQFLDIAKVLTDKNIRFDFKNETI